MNNNINFPINLSEFLHFLKALVIRSIYKNIYTETYYVLMVIWFPGNRNYNYRYMAIHIYYIPIKWYC